MSEVHQVIPSINDDHHSHDEEAHGAHDHHDHEHNHDGHEHNHDHSHEHKHEHKHGENCSHKHEENGEHEHKHEHKHEDGKSCSHDHGAAGHSHSHSADHKHDDHDHHDHGDHDHKHDDEDPSIARNQALRQLYIASVVSVFFVGAQLVGGIMAGSIAIMTDTAHLASDVIGFFISIMSIKLALKPADKALSYGWHRAEILGTILSVVFLWGLTIWLLFEATIRMINPELIDIQSGWMMITAWASLLFNIIQLKILGHSHHGHSHAGHDHDHGHSHAGHSHGDEKASQLNAPLIEGPAGGSQVHDHQNERGQKQKNINISSAELHVLGDLLSSVGVIIASIIIYFFNEAKIADPICTYVFSVIIMFTSIPILKMCINVLMEGSPDDYDLTHLEEEILKLEGVEEVHDLHVWSLSAGKHSLSAHIKSQNPLHTLQVVTQFCHKKEIFHTTIQVEGHDEHNNHHFECKNEAKH